MSFKIKVPTINIHLPSNINNNTNSISSQTSLSCLVNKLPSFNSSTGSSTPSNKYLTTNKNPTPSSKIKTHSLLMSQTPLADFKGAGNYNDLPSPVASSYKPIPSSPNNPYANIVFSDNDASSSTDNNNHDDNNLKILSEDDSDESAVLRSHGYSKKRKLTDTLQGSVFIALDNNSANNSVVVIKRTSKLLHLKRTTIQNGKQFTVEEDIIKEYKVLEQFNDDPHCPKHIAKCVDFFQSKNNYYLVMENGGNDLFDFIIKAHELLQLKKLKTKEWRKIVKCLFYQMVVVVNWLHNKMNCCHLDISLENMTIKHGNFILKPNGYYSIDPRVKIMFIDFGLAEFFNPQNNFKCKKYCGKQGYKSPEIYHRKDVFDARKADIWSLGVVLFMMVIGSPPYQNPNSADLSFKYYITPGNIEQLLYQWNKQSSVTVKLIDLMKNMLKVDINDRYHIENILTHNWLNFYYKTYKTPIYKSNNNVKLDRLLVYQLSQINKN